jgi:hypothetical protein
MVCYSCTLVGREVDRGVGIAGGNDGEALGSDNGAEALGECQGDIFFHGIVGEMGARVGGAVRGIDEDEIAIKGRESLRSRGGAGRWLGGWRRCRGGLRCRRRLCEGNGCAQKDRARGLEDKSIDRRHGSWGVRVRL